MRVHNFQFLFTGLMLVILTLNSCVPQQSSGGKRRSSSGASAEPTAKSTPPPPVFDTTGSIYWYSGNSSFDNIITLNEDIATVIYLRGEAVNSFLSSSLDGTALNSSKSYCMVASYNTSGAQKNLRIRAIPISFFNFQTSTQERLLRLDFPDKSSSQSTCSGTALNILTTPDSGSSVANFDSAFSTNELCPTCRGIIASTDVSLYLSNTGSNLTENDRLPESNLNLGDMILRIDTQSGSLDQGGSCSDSACLAKGFDCCLDGQCVNDGSLKPNASTEQDFTDALNDVASNPNNFINWPSIYFVCGATPPVPVATPTPLPDASATASARVEELIKDFNCLEEGKNAFPDFAGNNVCEPGFNQTSFEAVRSKVWAYCGCEANPFPTDPDDPSCPDFGLQATRDVFDNITDITCFTPQPPSEPTPFQNLSLGVNTRSAPHRFFRADTGEAVDDITTLETTVKPEGTPFQYTDNSSKTDPDCSGDSTGSSSAECQFNMNSIFGQFNVELDQARPATVVSLDFDQSYIISVISGFYTPCPTCTTDAWFAGFTAHPSSQNGNGLSAVGFTTNRETFGDNSTGGNYEDTHFGRACFLPPTMIPFSHKPELNVNQQRQDRLTTQAALFVNGYQRDWYGFNKGALIGSFDGAKWFAIGNNRRVTSTSGKLFLAINAPYADLTDPSDVIVQIILDQGGTLAPLHDYNPELNPDSTEQNTGGTCQFWHQCEVDTDCITRLGWEYMCVDTNNYRTRLQKYNVFAEELANQEYDNATFTRILQNGMPSGNRKRCVYRGAGAICKGDFTANLETNRQKMFACAPNFHCASLDASEFNSGIVRTPINNGNIRFGMDANILGRPKSYSEANETLPENVKENIRHNAEIFTTETLDIGICRPGRKITQTTLINQHVDRDTAGRTDYIGQVGACNSSGVTNTRVMGCPIIQRQEGSFTPKGDLLLTVNPLLQITQNSCGGESIYTDASGFDISPFSTIESDPIRIVNNIISPVIAKDACLRRPGSVCHTDLDCSPNRLHEVLAFAQAQEQFGDTEAELKYWQEGLICGQAAEKPLIQSDAYFDYDMSKNRCCREAGKDFTMYTQGEISSQTLNSNLDVDRFPHDDPTATGRYSRYVAAGARDESNYTNMSVPYSQVPVVDYTGNIPKAFQWKTLNDTGSLTCCGGGWIRKFTDGTVNWDDPSRLRINPTGFKCLNYAYEIPEQDPLEYFASPANFALEANRFCLSPLEGGCSQIPFPEPTSDGTIQVPILRNDSNAGVLGANTAVLDTTPVNTPTEGGVKGMEALSPYVPYEPVPFINTVSLNNETPSDRFTYFHSSVDYFGVSFYLPSYVGFVQSQPIGAVNQNLSLVEYVYYDADGAVIGTTVPSFVDPCTITNNPEQDLIFDQFCITNVAGEVVFHGRAASGDATDPGSVTDADGNPWDHAAIRITFNVPNGVDFFYNVGGAPVQNINREGMVRGNELYYLTKLGRLELLGIPQIFYEPIFCNTDHDKLVSGIFGNMEDRDDFFINSFSMAGANLNENGRPLISMYDERYDVASAAQTSVYDIGGTTVNDRAQFYDNDSNRNERFVFNKDSSGGEVVTIPEIFSPNDFRCCVKLGEASNEDGRCCSGNRDGDGLCKLPKGADLHVYFNKFVSGEGMGENLPGGGLLEVDFIPETGEPKITSAVLNKVSSLGIAFCESGEVRGGGAFGFFYPEPNNGTFQHRESVNIEDTRMYSIIDSTRDFDGENESGTSPFLEGFRWDHHLYCR